MPPPERRFDPPARSDLPVLCRWRDASHIRRRWPDFRREVDVAIAGATPPGFTAPMPILARQPAAPETA